MQAQVETIQMRISTRDLMDVKNAYNLYDTQQAVKFLVGQQHPNKEVLLEQGYSVDPCSVNSDAVILTVKVRGR